MSVFEQREQADTYLLELRGGDPFGELIRAAEVYRAAHGPACGLYPAEPHVMPFVATLMQAAGASRILDIGAGFGDSALWLADSGRP